MKETIKKLTESRTRMKFSTSTFRGATAALAAGMTAVGTGMGCC